MPTFALGERQIDQVIALGLGRRGTLYLTDRRLIFEYTEGMVTKKYHQVGISLADIQSVNAVHGRLGGRELLITTKDATNGFRTNRITIGIANRTRCPKCGGRVLETSMPDVVCEKCGTQYVLATRMGHGLFGGGLHAQLIEKSAPQPVAAPVAQPATQQAPAGRRFCFNCGSPVQEAAKFCPKCGTQLS